ncbi:MAG: translocation/assembly module TamB domain-containing protein, partial [Pseudomonadales bacterium]|nr:translocation/assembly module TamB domain-containing protein [Pseudomonadales bacterium]
GFVEARLDYPLNQPEAPLSGDITAQLSELGWLDPFVDFLSDLNGQADVAIQLAGTPNQPLIRGDVRLEKLSAFVPRLGVNLKNGALFLSHQQLQDWTLTGRLDSGEGSMRVDGTATVNSLTDWQSRLTIDGQALQTLGLENIKAQISPNLVVEADAQTLKVNGKIDIPQAEINLKELPASTVSVSKDEIILDTPDASDRQQSALAIYTDIDLVLGKQISFKGFGITGEMTGNLHLREEPERPLRIDGIVEIPKGFYKAYGQKLTINPGRLIFQGAPDNPAIDVRASRQIGEGIVGIHIGGTAEALVSELYAIPPLPPTETMALLITGKSLNSATQADASVLMSAVTSLGITQSAGLTQRLQRSFGLDVLSLSSNGGIEQSAVTIGKYLTPKLFISYVQDILTPNASVNLEYSLSKKLKIKAESGDSQSMDILYRIER